MWDWNNSKSVIMSSVLLKIAFALMVAAAVLMPMGVRWYGMEPKTAQYYVTLVDFYLVLVVGFFAAANLHKMLSNIKKGDVFIHNNTKNLRALSYCCFVAAILFFIMGLIRPTMFIIAAAAGFMGLILRVVKNVFARAVELREENDTTI